MCAYKTMHSYTHTSIHICVDTYTYVGSVAYVWFLRCSRVLPRVGCYSAFRFISSWLPLKAPPFVAIPLGVLSATSCPHVCPRHLEHRCGHVVANTPAEDSAAEKKASSDFVVTTPG